VVEPSWRSALGKLADRLESSLKTTLEAVLVELLKDNATNAKSLARAHAQCVISYLQEEEIAVRFVETEVEEVASYVEEGDSLPRSVPAIIATAVVHELSKRCQAKEATVSSTSTTVAAAADETYQNSKKKRFRFRSDKKKK
jgi:hypothetical protein